MSNSQPADSMRALRVRPVLVIVDSDQEANDRIIGELRRRYSSDYDVVAELSHRAGLAALERLEESGSQVCLALCCRDESGAGAEEEFFDQVHAKWPAARRLLMVNWGAWADRDTSDAIHRLMARGRIDYYGIKPWWTPDEYFHRTVTELLLEWERAGSFRGREVTLVAARWSPRTHELRSLLARNGVPHAYYPSDSARGRELLAAAGLAAVDSPVALLHDGRTMVDPTNADLAEAFGVATRLEADTTFDVIVVGAGPSGLAAAVYASSEGLHTLVVERESIGGQAGSSSLIRNYLGFSRGISGSELAQRAYQQAWVFGTRFLLMREAAQLRTEDGWHVLVTGEGERARGRAVVLATGVRYRRIAVPELEALEGAGVFYGASVAEASGLAGEDVFVVGGGNSAGQAAMHLARYARAVTLLVRGASLAESMSQYLQDQIAAAGIRVRFGAEVVGGGGEGRLETITLRDRASGRTWTERAAALFVLIGAEPHTDWLPAEIERDKWGYLLTGPDVVAGHKASRWTLERPPLGFETCVPGIFAIGDVRRRSIKRVASAVGEGSVVIQQVHEFLAGVPEHGTAPASVKR